MGTKHWQVMYFLISIGSSYFVWQSELPEIDYFVLNYAFQIYLKWLNVSASSNNLVQVVFVSDAAKVLLIGRKISPCNSIFIDSFTGMVFFQTIWSNSCCYSKGHCHMASGIGPWPRWKALSRESRIALQSWRRGINKHRFAVYIIIR